VVLALVPLLLADTHQSEQQIVPERLTLKLIPRKTLTRNQKLEHEDKKENLVSANAELTLTPRLASLGPDQARTNPRQTTISRRDS
jgi:hypothetical protein